MIIDSETGVSLGLLLGLGGSFVGGIFWISKLHSMVKKSLESIKEIKETVKESNEYITLARNNASRIFKAEQDLIEIKNRLHTTETVHSSNGERLARIETIIQGIEKRLDTFFKLNNL